MSKKGLATKHGIGHIGLRDKKVSLTIILTKQHSGMLYECIHTIIEYIPSRIPNSNSACLTMMRWDPESWTSDPHDNINVSAILWSGSYIFTLTPPRQCTV